jgi:hypothetical protein
MIGRLKTRQSRPTCIPLVVLITALCGAMTGCNDEQANDKRVAPPDSASVAFVAAHWERPIPPQGPPPDGWAPITTDLSPQACATCHPAQFGDWKTSFHAHAYSPGLEGQLVPWFESSPASVAQCMVCHGPLSEQLRQIQGPDGGYVQNADYEAGLERSGVVCAACHVRSWQRHGPPRRDGTTTPAPAGTPHAGAIRNAAFESSQFCGACHQFAEPAPNGKSLENTLREWEATEFAVEGVTCQTCHMPDRRHLWRGIHDPEMTRSGVTPEWKVQGDPSGEGFEVRLALTNTGTGHHFPTYVTPAVDLEIAFVSVNGDTLATRQRTLQREVYFDGSQWIEREDDRIPAGETRALEWTGAAPSGATRVVGRVIVRPDAFYTAMFNGLVPRTPADSPARPILEAALTAAAESPYVLFDWDSALATET